MSDNSNDLSDDYTGITSVLGGANAWSCYGGSRLILVDTSIKKYVKFDCTKPQIIKFSTNLSQLDCGVVAAFYMVAMESINNDYSGTLYNDAQGVGLTGTGTLNSKKSRSEIDLLEASSRSAQTTLHGYAINDTISQQADPNRWINNIDMDGIWSNANVDSNNGKFSSNFGNSSDSPLINTNDPIDVTCEITPNKVTARSSTSPSSVNFYTLTLTTTIKQNGKTLVLTVDSSKPNTKLSQTTSTIFPEYELEKMCFIYFCRVGGGGYIFLRN